MMTQHEDYVRPTHEDYREEEIPGLARYIGHRTPKGLVVKCIYGSRTYGTWFVSYDPKTERLGWPKTMPDFQPVDEKTAETVLFYARRAEF